LHRAATIIEAFVSQPGSNQTGIGCPAALRHCAQNLGDYLVYRVETPSTLILAASILTSG
jgi:hypothetical protein